MSNTPAARMEAIRDNMMDELEEMYTIVRQEENCDHLASRAKAYWYAQIKSILSKETEFMGGSMCDVQDTINDLREETEGEFEE